MSESNNNLGVIPEKLKIVRTKFDLIGNKKIENSTVEGEEIKPWPNVQFGIPNRLLRSAIFGIQREKRENILDTFTFLYKNKIEVTCSGPILNQDDSIVWQAILHAMKNTNASLGSVITIRKLDVLRHLGKTSAGKNYDWLIASLDRLSSTNFKCAEGKQRFNTNLISGYELNLDSPFFNVGISSFFEPLLSEDLTDIDIIRKSKLTSQLSRWLHDFYSSHNNPIPYSVEKLQSLCRSNKNPAKFKMALKKSIEDLKNCDPPLFREDSFLDCKENVLYVFKETGSPFVPSKKKDEVNPILEDNKKVNNLNSIVCL